MSTHRCENDDCWLDVTNEECLEKLLAEARSDQCRKDCAAVCFWCNNLVVAERATRCPNIGKWEHKLKNKRMAHCEAGPIHELHRQETQERPKP